MNDPHPSITFEQQIDFVRNIKGAASSILFILILSGRSLEAKELEDATGYSDKPIKKALTWLEKRRFVQYNGHHHGWSVCRETQLLLPFIHILEEPVDEKSGNSPKIGNIPISAPTTTTTINDHKESKNNSSSSKEGNEDRNIPDLSNKLPPFPTDRNTIEYWIVKAGVGNGSPKFHKLMNADLDWSVVRAHALERLANPKQIWPGLFITRLLQGDPPPTIQRCEDCYGELISQSADGEGYCRHCNIWWSDEEDTIEKG